MMDEHAKAAILHTTLIMVVLFLLFLGCFPQASYSISETLHPVLVHFWDWLGAHVDWK